MLLGNTMNMGFSTDASRKHNAEISDYETMQEDHLILNAVSVAAIASLSLVEDLPLKIESIQASQRCWGDRPTAGMQGISLQVKAWPFKSKLWERIELKMAHSSTVESF